MESKITKLSKAVAELHQRLAKQKISRPKSRFGQYLSNCTWYQNNFGVYTHVFRGKETDYAISVKITQIFCAEYAN